MFLGCVFGLCFWVVFLGCVFGGHGAGEGVEPLKVMQNEALSKFLGSKLAQGLVLLTGCVSGLCFWVVFLGCVFGLCFWARAEYFSELELAEIYGSGQKTGKQNLQVL